MSYERKALRCSCFVEGVKSLRRSIMLPPELERGTKLQFPFSLVLRRVKGTRSAPISRVRDQRRCLLTPPRAKAARGTGQRAAVVRTFSLYWLDPPLINYQLPSPCTLYK